MNTKYETILIDKKWIEDSISPGWQRDLYPSQVNYFANQLRNNTFRDHSVITVKWCDKKKCFMIIDGQHRIAAIETTSISAICDLRILNGIEMPELMDEYGAAQTIKIPRIIDILKLHANGYKNKYLLMLLDEKNFPITTSLKGGVNSIRIDNLLNIIFNGFRPIIGKCALGRKNLVKFLDSLDEEKIETTKKFFKFYKECFGEPDMQNWVYRTILVQTLMKIWLANNKDFKETELINVFREIEENSTIRQLSGTNDYNSREIMIKSIYRLINKHRSANKFNNFWDEQIEVPMN